MTEGNISRPTAWRLMLLAFALWAAVFVIGYGAALLAPNHWATDALLILLSLASIPLLFLLDRKAVDLPQRAMVRASLIVAGLAILFNGLAAIG